MFGIQQLTEITLHVPNDLGSLATLFSAIASEQRHVHAWCLYGNHERTTVLVVTGHETRTERVLRAAGFVGQAQPVIVVGAARGNLSALQVTAELRAAGINIRNAYACSSPGNGPVFVLKTTDDARAATVLQALDLREDGRAPVVHAEPVAATLH